MTDLYMAPVLLALEERIEQFGALNPDELANQIALESDLPDYTTEFRSEALLKALAQPIDLHDWSLSLVPRGIRVAHDDHAVVLGITPNLVAYVLSH